MANNLISAGDSEGRVPIKYIVVFQLFVVGVHW